MNAAAAIEPTETVETAATPAAGYPDLSSLTVRKIPHKNMILDGVCTNCAHCWQKLTDSVSVQRGIGPDCSKKGYSEDPTDGDEMAAFICLAEFQELVEFLTEHYKPLGIRGLVNGLVRVASLNRPHGRGQEEGNEKLFAACCDAIEALGHGKMATLLRETLVGVWIDPVEGQDGLFAVKTMKRKTPDSWWWFVRRDLAGSEWIKGRVGGGVHHVRFHEAGNPKAVKLSSVSREGRLISNKLALWELMLTHFKGSTVKVSGKAVKIAPKKEEQP